LIGGGGLEIESKAVYILDKHSTTELYSPLPKTSNMTFVEMSLTILHNVASIFWAQVILLPQPPKLLALQMCTSKTDFSINKDSGHTTEET
jgi:hypothetical protein